MLRNCRSGALRKPLDRAGVKTLEFHPPPFESSPEALVASMHACKRAKAVSHEALGLPMFPQLRPERQVRIAEVLRGALWCGGGRASLS